MFNSHIHQQQQQQQLQQHLRQLQHLFHQQQQQHPPPPPPPQPPPAHHVPHHHQAQRTIPVPAQAAPPPRMVNLCQTNQTTIIAPNPMLQGALMMQQMQGSMRGFGMGGQQFRHFYAAGSRSSLLGPIPMGMAIKTPMMGFPTPRPFHQHARYYNSNTSASSSSTATVSATDVAARHSERKRDSDQMATGSTNDQLALPAASDTTADKTQTDDDVTMVTEQTSVEQLEEPAVKRQKTAKSEKSENQDKTGPTSLSECNRNTVNTQIEGCGIQEDLGSCRRSDVADVTEDTGVEHVGEDYICLPDASTTDLANEEDQQVNLPAEEHKDTSMASSANQDEDDEGIAEGSNKYYCYLCSITCHNQQNFRSHMNSISHQQRMMEIQYMSNACLVTLLPRVQESLQGANKDGEKKGSSKHWCATCHSHFNCTTTEHRRSEEHKLAVATNFSTCTVCKKHFKASQQFLEHLHSQEHRQKLQEKGSDAVAKLTAGDTDEFSLDSEGVGSEEDDEERQQIQRDTQDDWPALKEVTLNDIASHEEYDPDTVYGSSFLVPVAGFICRLCNKFYHFESSAAHSHCKSLKHFENLRRYGSSVRQKEKAAHSPAKSFAAADSFGSVTDSPADCPDDNLLSLEEDAVPDLNSSQPEQAEIGSDLQHLLSISALCTGDQDPDLSLPHYDEENSSYAAASQEDLAELPVGGDAEAELQPAPKTENSNEDEGEEDTAARSGKKNNAGKAKTAPKRRSGRAANRR